MAQAALDRFDALYGGAPPIDGGVVHVASVWRDPDGNTVVLRIGPDAPKSAADAFALSSSRARADAILTTGAILREEPQMVALPFGADATSLRAARSDIFGRSTEPALMVLSRGDVDPAHPALRCGVRPYVLTGREGAAKLRASGVTEACQVVELEVPCAASAITWAKKALLARTVTIEAGPTTALGLYRGAHRAATDGADKDGADEDGADKDGADKDGAATARVDELLLSIVQTAPPLSVRGKPFLTDAQVRAAFGSPVSECMVDEPDGPWLIQRWRR